MDEPNRREARIRCARVAFRVLFFLALAAVLFLSLMPGENVHATFSKEIQSKDHDFHLLSYLALGALFLEAFVRRAKVRIALRVAVFAAFAALGGLLEIAQSTPLVNRSASWDDAAHNTAGAAIGAFLTPAFLLLP